MLILKVKFSPIVSCWLYERDSALYPTMPLTVMTLAMLNRQTIDKRSLARMATLNFNGIGGDGYPKIDVHPSVNTGFVDAEVLKGYRSTFSIES